MFGKSKKKKKKFPKKLTNQKKRKTKTTKNKPKKLKNPKAKPKPNINQSAEHNFFFQQLKKPGQDLVITRNKIVLKQKSKVLTIWSKLLGSNHLRNLGLQNRAWLVDTLKKKDSVMQLMFRNKEKVKAESNYYLQKQAHINSVYSQIIFQAALRNKRTQKN